MSRRLLLAFLPLVVVSCTSTLPEQDRRITEARPSERLTVEVLWKDYQADRAAAEKRYHGKAIDVSGKVTSIETAAPQRLMFVMAEPAGIEARLLDDRADAVMKAAKVGERILLRCYVSGFETNVVLKSCIQP